MRCEWHDKDFKWNDISLPCCYACEEECKDNKCCETDTNKVK